MKFADCTSEDGRTVVSEINMKNMKKYITSLRGGTVDRKDAGKMVMTFGLSTNVMSKNVHPQKNSRQRIE